MRRKIRMEIIRANDRYYVCKEKNILALFKDLDDTLEFVRLYNAYIKRYSFKNSIKEFWRWLTLIF